jgi:hypothetical protein
MTVLDQEFLQSVLPVILGIDPKYVIPRQGTFFNPQDMLPTPEKPMTWCAFALEDENPATITHYVVDGATPPQNWSVQHKIGWLALQFVGTRAKAMASSIGHWTQRQDVRDNLLGPIDGQIFADSGRVSVVDFVQEGQNTVKAYTARVHILYASEIETGQVAMPGLVFQGGVS